MSEKDSQNLNEVHTVAKEKKILKLVGQYTEYIAFGFDATFDEISDFYIQTYEWGTDKIEQELGRAAIPEKIYQIQLVAECSHDTNGNWCIDDNWYSVWTTDFFIGDEALGEYSSYSRSVSVSHQKDLFHYFGLELQDEINKMQLFVEKEFNAYGKNILEGKDPNYVIADVDMAEISDAGKMVISAASEQQFHNPFSPVNGKISVFLRKAGVYEEEGALMVNVVSKLTWRERNLKYGRQGLNKSKISCFHKYGCPTPVVDYLNIVEKELGIFSLAIKYVFVSREDIESFIQGKITGANLINQFGEKIQRFFEEEHFKIA